MIPKKYAILFALTSELVVVELVLIYAGSWVDQKYSWPGYGVICGAMIGLMAWVFHLILALKNFNDPEDE
jgi:hypothetical protein